MIIKIREQEDFERESFRIQVKGNEYLIKENAEGFSITEITDSEILIRPQVANSIVVVTPKKR